MNLAEQYIEDVRTGKILVCEYVKLCIDRHLKFLENADEKGIYFDRADAQFALDFIGMLRHTKGSAARKLFQLQGWQAFIIWSLFGWKVIETGYRLFTKAYIEMAKKNGKTEFAAAIANYVFLLDGEFGSEIYMAATKRDQSKICFNAAKTMLKFLSEESPKIKSLVTFNKLNLSIEDTNSKMEPLGADSNTMDGINTHLGIIDEYHAHPNSDVAENIQSSMVARAQPLHLTITTAGFNLESECYNLRKTAVDILKEIKEDDSFFMIIYTLDDPEEWDNKKMWAKANPNLGISVSMRFLESEFKKAKNEGITKEIAFKTKNLNLWLSSVTGWISDNIWRENGFYFETDLLKGRPVFSGLDLAATSDIAARVNFYPPFEDDETMYIKPHFYCPQDTAKQKSNTDRVNYFKWHNEGFLTLTPGNVIDYDYIKKDIIKDVELSDVKGIGYDRWNSYSFVPDLIEEGINMQPYGQGFASMNMPCKQLEVWAMQRRINHGQDPVLRWMLSNVALKMDAAGNIKIDKAKSSEKVDGIVALVIAIGIYLIWLKENEDNNPYEEEGIFFL